MLLVPCPWTTGTLHKVNLNRAAIVPSLQDRKEGSAAHIANIAKLPLIAKPGWFSDRK